MDTLVLRNLTYGLFVIGTKDGSRPTGCTVNSVGQVTSDPAMISVCINHDNWTNRCIKEAKGFSVSILSEDCSGEVIGRFGFRSGKDTDKFEGIPYSQTPGGFPILEEGTCGWLECSLETTLELPTHTLFIGRLADCKPGVGTPMTYAYYHRVIRGKTPPKAPSYEPPRRNPAPASEPPRRKIWTCPICGYQYDGSQGPFEDLPADWVCPICGVSKGEFTGA